jgi:hypothetical protein
MVTFCLEVQTLKPGMAETSCVPVPQFFAGTTVNELV